MDTLWPLRVSLRQDLQVSRQISAGLPVYVLHDPVSFRSHKLQAEQYVLLAELETGATLQQHFEGLVRQGRFRSNEACDFLQLILAFARMNLIRLPGRSGHRLFDQHTARRKVQRTQTWLSFLFLKIPLVNPDRFLACTVGRVSWLFTRTAGVIWLVGMLAALLILCSRAAELTSPLSGLLATSNLLFLWCSFVALKIWHELGHGYACRAQGAEVPEMGMMLLAGMPAAYVDATAAWNLPQRRQRLLVMAGGMYFESLVFILSVFVWAFTEHALLRSCAYQLLVMSSLVTVLFNANPLLQFDGYFILSELTGIQNLRTRAMRLRKQWFLQYALRLPADIHETGIARRCLLGLYALCAGLYRTLIVFSIAMAVATRFPLIGLVLAAFHLVTSVVTSYGRLLRWLLVSDETRPARTRACFVAAVLGPGLPALLCLIPVPFPVVTDGEVAAEVEHSVNTTAAGTLTSLHVRPGQRIAPGTVLARLDCPDLLDEQTRLEYDLDQARLAVQIAQPDDPASAAARVPHWQQLQYQLQAARRQLDLMNIRTTVGGQVASVPTELRHGSYLLPGTPIALLVDGHVEIRVWLDEQQLGDCAATRGTEVTFRLAGQGMQEHRGQIVAVAPAAEVRLPDNGLLWEAGGTLLTDPQTGRPLSPLFEVRIRPSSPQISLTEHGTRVSVRLPRSGESMAAWALRRVIRFVHQLWKI